MLLRTINPGGVTDHGLLTGLADDDHAQYVLANGSRALSADWNAGSFKITAANFEVTDSKGLIVPATDTYAFTPSGEPTTGLQFNTTNTKFNFVRNGTVLASINASTVLDYSFLALKKQALRIQDDSYAFVLASAVTTGLYFNNVNGNIELHYAGNVKHSFGMASGDYTAMRDVIVNRAVRLKTYTDATRPSASTVGAGAMIFNSDDNFPNVSDGTNWRDMNGNVT